MERLDAKALLLDVDGTLLEDDVALPGAVDAVSRLRGAGVPLRFVTNTTRRPARIVAEGLRAAGLEVRPGDLITPAVAAARWLEEHGFRRVALYLPDPSREDFAALDLVEDAPQAIVVGDLGAGWTFERLNRAYEQLRAGARLVALHRNRVWRSGGRLLLDAGPFVAALEYAAGVDAIVVGKPTGTFFELACAGLDLPPQAIAMVGDDIESDVGGAQAAGLRGVLVRTGKFTEGGTAASSVRPDAVINDIGEVMTLLSGEENK